MQYQQPQDWSCQKCGFINMSLFLECTRCKALNPANQMSYQPYLKACPSCNSHVSNQALACPRCGHPQQTQFQQPPIIQVMNQVPPKSRAAYIIIGLLIGGLGIHNFYAGHNGRGIAQLAVTLLTAWMCFPIVIMWVWVIIEVIATNTDGYGRRMI